MKTIKRYANRKLYDADVGGYINLSDLIAYAKNDIEFEVIENKEGHRVITSEILSMAIHVHIQRNKTEAHHSVLLSIMKSL